MQRTNQLKQQGNPQGRGCQHQTANIMGKVRFIQSIHGYPEGAGSGPLAFIHLKRAIIKENPKLCASFVLCTRHSVTCHPNNRLLMSAEFQEADDLNQYIIGRFREKRVLKGIMNKEYMVRWLQYVINMRSCFPFPEKSASSYHVCLLIQSSLAWRRKRRKIEQS
jgi:hypothetical protein